MAGFDALKLSACLHMYLKWGGFPMVVRDLVNRSVAQGTGFPSLDSATKAEEAVAVHLVRSFANTWAAFGFMDSLYYWRSRKGKEVDFVFYLAQGTEPFGVEVKYQGHLSGWDEQSIQKGIG